MSHGHHNPDPEPYPQLRTKAIESLLVEKGLISTDAVDALPDAVVQGKGACPEPLYSVRFEATELWGDSAEPRQTVNIDLWESYLEPDPDQEGRRA